jgi:hypothetical protein
MPRIKTKMLTCKVSPDTYKEYQVAAKLKGGTMSGLIHMFVVRTIDEQKEGKPDAFRKALQSGVPVAPKTLKLKHTSKQKKA